jgi:hypothetical protein
MKFMRQSKILILKDIQYIIRDYCDSLINYTQFSYKITPYLFRAIDKEIKDNNIEKILLQVIDLMEMYLDNDITTEIKLKENLRCLL